MTPLDEGRVGRSVLGPDDLEFGVLDVRRVTFAQQVNLRDVWAIQILSQALQELLLSFWISRSEPLREQVPLGHSLLVHRADALWRSWVRNHIIWSTIVLALDHERT